MRNMIACVALMSFPLSIDGINVNPVEKGERVDIPDDLFDGLKEAGYIERAQPGDENKSLGGPPANTGGGEDRDALVERAAELGLKHNVNLGVPKLTALIADEEARLAAEANTGGGEDGDKG